MKDDVRKALSGQDYAPWELTVFNYRKTFGLSYSQWLEEPAKEFAKNVAIMETISEHKQYIQKMQERKSKMR